MANSNYGYGLISPRGAGLRGRDLQWQQILVSLTLGIAAGFLLGWVVMETTDVMYHTGASNHVSSELAASQTAQTQASSASSSSSTSSSIRAAVTTVKPLTGTGSKEVTSAATTAAAAASKPAGDTIHSIITSSGSAYQNFQGRIMYGTYKLVQKMPGGEKLTGFTRILHKVEPDECMDEIPTFHAKPLHPECDIWCDFPVADRPNAVAQWIASAQRDPSIIKGAWIVMLECDYVWMKPLQAPGNAYDPSVLGQQFHFGYIMAQHADCSSIIKRLYGGKDPADVPNSGPAPAMLRFTDLVAVTPEWERVTAAIEADKEAVKVLGWVREMYAWDIALAIKGIKMKTEDPPTSPLIAQPPADRTIGNAAMFHYTWGAIYNDSTHQVFRWDKRDYTDIKHALKPMAIPLPPDHWEPGKWHLQDRLPVTKDLHETLTSMLRQMNRAIETLPDLTDEYNALKLKATA